jgi:succinate dehydrogenase / fumarate reductase, cytochrome b subunit
MSTARTFFQSTIGKKAIMAATGLVMVGFVITHVAGNLLVFAGPGAMNAYAAALKATGGLLWGARAFLLASVGLHIWAAVSLTAKNRAARPVAYAKKTPQESTLASRTMVYGGLLLAAFLVFHLLHFTTGTIQPAPFSHVDVHGNMIGSFQVPWVAGLYVAAMIALGLHLAHGAWASFRTLGLSKRAQNPFRRRASVAVAIAVWLGFTIIPVAVLAGVVK